MPGTARILVIVVCAVFSACRAEPAAPVALEGQPFPSVVATSLDGSRVALPESRAGAPCLLLVAFEQEAQFDCDRWLLGLLQARTPVAVLEVPTIPSRIASVVAGAIDGGMREGIPEEDWSSVATLYGDDARTVFEFTGGRSDRNARAILLDAQGRVAWHAGRGYSARLLAELDEFVRGMAAPAEGSASAGSAASDSSTTKR